jgi:hypothetical protein
LCDGKIKDGDSSSLSQEKGVQEDSMILRWKILTAKV